MIRGAVVFVIFVSVISSQLLSIRNLSSANTRGIKLFWILTDV